FPNPTVNKQFTVLLSGLNAGFVTFDLVSVSGQVVRTRSIQATGATLEQGISLPKEVAAGMYNLVVKTADKTVRTRVTVK
ncbi:MAG: T9SS type A sorting domain-containing protein, partial [Flexibacteraceae bacterium]